jgi:kinesin family protein 1
MQTINEKEIFDWLYALNPLLAGEIRSKLSRRKQDSIQQHNVN